MKTLIRARRVGRQYTYQLRSGHKVAHLVAEQTNYLYMTSLDVPKKWFTANIDPILFTYGESHKLEKEDVYLSMSFLIQQL
jgi:hypothetical protein